MGAKDIYYTKYIDMAFSGVQQFRFQQQKMTNDKKRFPGDTAQRPTRLKNECYLSVQLVERQTTTGLNSTACMSEAIWNGGPVSTHSRLL